MRFRCLIVGMVLVLDFASHAQQPSLLETAVCTGEAANLPHCKDKVKAADALSAYEIKHEELSSITNPPWDAQQLERARELAAEAYEFTSNQYLGDAAIKFDEALQILELLEFDLQNAVAGMKARAVTLASQQSFDEARVLYRQIAQWDPENVEIQERLAELDTNEQHMLLLDEVELLIATSRFDEALSKLRTVVPSYRDARWTQLHEEIERPRREARFRELVSRGRTAKNNQQWQEALDAFDAALKVKPKELSVSELREETIRQKNRAELDALNQSLESSLANEDWATAESFIQKLLQRDQGTPQLEHQQLMVRQRIDIEATTDQYLNLVHGGLDRRTSIRLTAFLQSHEDLDLGNRIGGKMQTLALARDEWNNPVVVTVISDNRTEVNVRPAGLALGKFKSKTLEILPGEYRFSGIRRGYLETVKEVKISPNQPPIELTVICNERF